jgi:hypothetical protein
MPSFFGAIANSLGRVFSSFTMTNNPYDTVLGASPNKRSVGSGACDVSKVTAQMASNSFVTVYEEYDGVSVFTQYLRAGTYTSSGTITLGAAVSFDTLSGGWELVQVRRLSDTKGILIWDKSTSTSYQVWGQHFTISGSTITLNTKVLLLSSHQNARVIGLDSLDSSRMVLFLRDGPNFSTLYHRYQIVDTSGTNCALSGSPVDSSVSVSLRTGRQMYALGGNTFAVFYSSDSFEFEVALVTLVGSTFTEGSRAVLDYNPVSKDFTVEPISPTSFLVAKTENAAGNGSFFVVQYSGTTVSTVGTKTSAFGRTTANCLRKLPNGQILATYTIVGQPYAHLLSISGSNVAIKSSQSVFINAYPNYMYNVHFLRITDSLYTIFLSTGAELLSVKITLT